MAGRNEGAGNRRQDRCQVDGYNMGTVSREISDESASRGPGGSRKRRTERARESKLELMESFDGFA